MPTLRDAYYQSLFFKFCCTDVVHTIAWEYAYVLREKKCSKRRYARPKTYLLMTLHHQLLLWFQMEEIADAVLPLTKRTGKGSMLSQSPFLLRADTTRGTAPHWHMNTIFGDNSIPYNPAFFWHSFWKKPPVLHRGKTECLIQGGASQIASRPLLSYWFWKNGSTYI